jgi:hypothetical protein
MPPPPKFVVGLAVQHARHRYSFPRIDGSTVIIYQCRSITTSFSMDRE